MDEIEAMFAEFADALKSLTELPKQIVEDFKSLSSTVTSFNTGLQQASAAAAQALTPLDRAAATAGAAIAQLSIGTFSAIAVLEPAFQAAGNAARGLGNLLTPAFQEMVSVVKDVGQGFAALGAPVLNEFKLLVGILPDVGRGLKLLGEDLATVGRAVLPVLAPVVQRLQFEFTAMGRELGQVVLSLGDGFRRLVTDTASLSAMIGVTTGGLSTAVGMVSNALGSLTGAFGSLTAMVTNAGKGLLSALANPLSGLARGFNFAAGPTSAMAQAMMSAIQGITGALMGPFQALAAAVGPFVQALNPGLMRLFNQSMRDLMATFGVAFAPVIRHITAIFNELSATLTPLMHTLAPIIDNLMSRLEGVLVPMVGVVAEAFRSMSPAIEVVTGVMADIAEASRVVVAVFQSALSTLYGALRQMFGLGDLKNVGQQLQDAIRQMTTYFVRFAAYIAKALGYLDPFAAALAKNLRDLKGQQPGQKAAPENMRVAGLEQISKDLAVAAFAAQVATGGASKKSEAEYLEELVKQLEELRKSKDLQTMLDQEMEQLRERVEGFLRDFFNEKWSQAKEFTTQQVIEPILAALRGGPAGALAGTGTGAGLIAAAAWRHLFDR